VKIGLFMSVLLILFMCFTTIPVSSIKLALFVRGPYSEKRLIREGFSV
jgi:hypothetical protein